MILTKDNLLRFVREKKYTTPANVAEAFETSTMIASAALSEIAKEKSIAITHLKLASSPYYYDPRQAESLQDLAEKHLKNYDKECYIKLKEEQVINDNSLTIQLRLAVNRISDFAKLLEISYEGREMKFWVWYLRDLDETRKQIMDVIKGKPATSVKKAAAPKKVEAKKTELPQPKKVVMQEPLVPKKEAPSGDEDIENFIENYFRENYLKIESKNKEDKNIHYDLALKVNKMVINFDSIYYGKKPTESDILKFYASSPKPKIIFAKNIPKKLFKLAENLENITVVNI